jgi:hypothetical protein
MEAMTGQRLGRVLKRAEQALLRAKSAALKPAGLTLAQYVALTELDRQPGITGASLARKGGNGSSRWNAAWSMPSQQRNLMSWLPCSPGGSRPSRPTDLGDGAGPEPC